MWACASLALVAPLGRGGRVNLAAMMAGVVGLVVLGAVLWAARDPYPFAGGKAVGRWRDFYGVVTVYRANEGEPGRECVLFRHAGVTHGLQFTDPVKRRMATAYFGADSGVGISLRVAQSHRTSLRVGVVGLGAGTLAAYGRSGDTFRFYELSPTVVRVARDKFTYLADSQADCQVIQGDGRLSLQVEPQQQFDVLVLDAFTGHAIPYHLLTAQAFTLYRRHLAPGGVIAVNVTNSFVDIQPVIAQQAARANLTPLLFSRDFPAKIDDSPAAQLDSDWVLLTDDAALLATFRQLGGVTPRVDPSLKLWTDEYASLYPVLR
jgi:SAM-dependent methyltransferase